MFDVHGDLAFCTALVLAIAAVLLFLYAAFKTGWKFPVSLAEAREHGPLVVLAFVLLGAAALLLRNKARDVRLANKDQKAKDEHGSTVDSIHEDIKAVEQDAAEAITDAGKHEAAADAATEEADKHSSAADIAHSAAEDALAQANRLREERGA